jgi:AraC-like DNA-binding protein
MARTVIRLYNYDMLGEDLRVRVNSCGRMRCSPDWSWDTAPGLVDFDLISIHGGGGEYSTADEVVAVQAGSCLLLRPGRRYVGTQDPENPMDVTWVHFDYLDAGGVPARQGRRQLPALYRSLENSGFFFELLGRLLAAFRSGRSAEATLWLRGALFELARQDARPRWSGGQQEQARAVEELCARIRREPGARWRVPEMARRFYCTPDHFGRLFRKYVGTTPGEFVLRARIDAAMGLLRSSSHSVTRIAELLGYVDVYAFSRQFKQRTGRTPTGYRRG